jgi:hypothetical protein
LWLPSWPPFSTLDSSSGRNKALLTILVWQCHESWVSRSIASIPVANTIQREAHTMAKKESMAQIMTR